MMINFILGFIVGGLIGVLFLTKLTGKIIGKTIKELNTVTRDIPNDPRRPKPANEYNCYGVGYKDNSNLEGMRHVPPSKSGPPKPPCRQPNNNELVISIDIDVEKFKKQWDEATLSSVGKNLDIFSDDGIKAIYKKEGEN